MNTPALTLDTLARYLLQEDLWAGDVTTAAFPPQAQTQWVTASVVARQPGIMSGHAIATSLCRVWDPALKYQLECADGERFTGLDTLATLTGPAAAILQVERTLLNTLQHLCGVASTTRTLVDAVDGLPVRIVHTRKTTPGLRLLEQMAVRHGGGFAHRRDLAAAAMVKDNHWLLAGCSLPVLAQRIRAELPHTARLEIEVDQPAQVDEALAAGADIVLLDNFTPEQVRWAVDHIAGRALVEVSGGITVATVRAYAEAGANVISTSQMTLGAPAIDIGLDVLTED